MPGALCHRHVGTVLRGEITDGGKMARGATGAEIDDETGFQWRKAFDHGLHERHGLENKTVPSAVLHVLTGPTAVGKTDWALRWAERNDGEIISCDSLLFYRGMDIGTAKPGPADRARVPHHLIDIRSVMEPMNVTLYVALARKAVQEIS